jgi:hypothetical protein
MRKARMRTMMTKRTIRVLVALATTFILTCTGATAAYANAPDDTGTSPLATAAETEPTETPQTVSPTEPKDAAEAGETTEPVPLTPDGNLTLVNDIDGDEAADKQFLTVITKGGNYFYIVIDRAGDTENVHFLNLVDEADLLALIEGEAPTTSVTPTPTEPDQQPVQQMPVESEEEANNLIEIPNLTGILALVVVAALAGAGVLFYVKVLRQKKGRKGTGEIGELDLDDYDFGDGDDALYGMSETGSTEPDIDEPTDDGQETEADK